MRSLRLRIRWLCHLTTLRAGLYRAALVFGSTDARRPHCLARTAKQHPPATAKQYVGWMRHCYCRALTGVLFAGVSKRTGHSDGSLLQERCGCHEKEPDLDRANHRFCKRLREQPSLSRWQSFNQQVRVQHRRRHSGCQRHAKLCDRAAGSHAARPRSVYRVYGLHACRRGA